MRDAVRLVLAALPDLTTLSANARRRGNHWVQQKATREAKALWWPLVLVALDGKEPPHWDYASIKFTVVFGTRRRRDTEAIVSALKPLVDVLKDEGFFEHDDTEHLRWDGILVEVDKARAPLTIVEIEEAG